VVEETHSDQVETIVEAEEDQQPPAAQPDVMTAFLTKSTIKQEEEDEKQTEQQEPEAPSALPETEVKEPQENSKE